MANEEELVNIEVQLVERKVVEKKVVGTKGMIKTADVVRLLAEALNSLGYSKTRSYLEEESGISMHSQAAELFRLQILEGEWNESISSLHKLGLNETKIRLATLLIYEQKFKELLREGKQTDAVKFMREDFLSVADSERRAEDISILFCERAEDIQVESREKLLEKLDTLLSPVTIPKYRLFNLIEEALSLQASNCPYHNSSGGRLLLLPKHRCRGARNVPSKSFQILREHTSEVCILQFSKKGKYLASGSRDGVIIIWKVKSDDRVCLMHELRGYHRRPVCCIEWRSDDNQFLTCGREEVVKRWDTISGQCLQVYEKKRLNLGLVSCAWAGDDHLVTGVTDRSVIEWDLEGIQVKRWQGLTPKTENLGVKGDNIFSIYKEKKIGLFGWETGVKRKRIKENNIIISFTLSQNKKLLLVCLDDGRLHLWNVARRDPMLVGAYEGPKPLNLNLRGCFGGVRNAYIASGNRDNRVYIWNRFTGQLLHTLKGHSQQVNSVSWNPKIRDMLASASDDHTICIWGKWERGGPGNTSKR